MVTCYFKKLDAMIIDSSAFVCNGSRSRSGFYSCCSPSDTCLSNSICYSRKANPNDSSFYLGACTDPEYADINCNVRCLDTDQAHIVYNESTGLWNCCVQGSCLTPSNKTFQAPSPQVLLSQSLDALSVIPSTTSASSTSKIDWTSAVTFSTSAASLTSTLTLSKPASNSTSAIPSSTSRTSPTPAVTSATNANLGQVAKSSSLGTGTAAGIGTGAAIGGLAILIAIILFIVYLRRRRRIQDHSSHAFAGGKAELSANSVTPELAADIHQERQELGT